MKKALLGIVFLVLALFLVYEFSPDSINKLINKNSTTASQKTQSEAVKTAGTDAIPGGINTNPNDEEMVDYYGEKIPKSKLDKHPGW